MASTKVRGISIELSADSSGIVKGLKEANSSIRNTQKELRAVDKLLKLNPNNITLIKQRTQALQTQIGNTKNKLTELKKAEADMKAKGVDENSEQFKALQREIIATQSKLDKLNSTAGSGSSTLYGISQATGKIGDSATKAGKALMPVTAGITAMGGAAIAAFNEVDDGADIVIKKTGATGQAAKDLEGVYQKVATTVKGSFEDAGKAVGEVNTRFQLTGSDLEELSSDFMKFAEITDQDVESAVAGVDLAMKTFNVDGKDAKGVLGLLAKTSQRTGISVDTLESSLQNSGAQLKEMGLDLGASVTLMGNFEASGIDSNTMLARLGKGAATFQKKGMNMQEGLNDLISRLKNSSTESDATAEAYEIFGSRGALAFITAAKEGKLAFDGLSTDLNSYRGVVDDTYEGVLDETDQAQILWKQLKTTLADVGASLLKTLAPALQKAAEFVKRLSDGWRGLSDGTKKTIITIGGIVAAIGPALLMFGKMATAISAITKVMSTMKFTAFLTNPVTLAIGAIAALVAGIAALVNAYEEGIKQSHPFREELDGLKKSSEETSKAISDTKTAYEDAADGAAVEAEKAQFLNDRLQELMSTEEKTAGQKEEIKQLVKQLNEIMPELGLSYDEVTDSLNRTNDEIRTNINLMKAQAEADAASKAYSSAVENRLKATQEMNKAQRVYDETLAQSSAKAQEYAKAVENGASELELMFTYTAGEIEQGKHLVEAKEAATKATENYNTSLSDEADFEKILQGTNAKLAAETKKSAATINKQNLKAFREELKKTFGTDLNKSLEAAVNRAAEAGVDIPDELKQGILDGSVDVDTAINEINKAVQAGLSENNTPVNKAGQTQGGHYVEGVDSKRPAAKKAGTNLANETKTGAGSNGKALEKTGQNAGGSYTSGVDSKRGAANKSGQNLAGEVNKGTAANNQGKTRGGQYGAAYSAGIDSKAANAYAKGKNIAGQANKGAADNNYGGTRGGQWGNNYNSAIDGKKKTAYNKAYAVAGQANKGAADNNYGGTRGSQWGSNYTGGIDGYGRTSYNKGWYLAGQAGKGARDNNNGYNLGSIYGKSYGDGIASQLGYAYAKGEALAERAWRGTQDGQKSGSPSKVAIGLGHDFSDGYGIGIEDMFKNIFNIGAALASQAIGGAGNLSALTANQPAALAGAGAAAGGTVNNYTQNNYSPAALSAADIYRQTNNLINLKGVGA